VNRDKQVTAARMRAGESGVVVRIAGGHGLIRRLEALGIRPGKRITKVSSMFRRGPVTIRAGHTQVALGFGMADKIEVDLDTR
jgi:ferrous iron transport protein A